MHSGSELKHEVTEEFVALMCALDRLCDQIAPQDVQNAPPTLRERLIALMHAHLVFRDLWARYDSYGISDPVPSRAAIKVN